MGKVKLSLEIMPNLLMPGKLSAVVRGDGLDLQRLQLCGHGLCDQLRCVTHHFCQARQFRLSLDHTDNRRLVIAPDDRVSFPIAEPCLVGHYCGALVYASTVGNLSAPRVTAAAFAPRFPAPQVARERAARSFVRINVLINALVAEARLLFEFEAS